MIKKHIKTVIITSIITLVPLFVGLILWERLPDTIATHFGANNEPNGWSSKAFTVFGIPFLMLALHIVCIFSTKLDPKMKNINDKIFKLVLCIIPATSILMALVIYPSALGKEIKIGFIVIVFMGILFCISGNYLPKCKQSYTVGIKLPWTLESGENWNRTHALAGKVWVIGGLIILATAFLESPVIFGTIVAIMIIFPIVYSYLFYRKEKGKSEK